MSLDVDPVRVTGRWVRHAYPGGPAFADRDPPPDNRWQRGDHVDALYLAVDDATAWAEWYRHLAERGLPPHQQLPRDLWQWEIDVEVADLSDAARLARVGLTTPTTRPTPMAAVPACRRGARGRGLVGIGRSQRRAPRASGALPVPHLP